MNYVNPYKLFSINTENSSELSVVELRKAKIRLLQTLLLEDGKVDYLNEKISLNNNDIHRLSDELEDEEKRLFHYEIQKDHFLLEFLSKSSTDKIDSYKPESIYDNIKFKKFIAPYFTESYNYVLSNAIKKNNRQLVKRIIELKPLIDQDKYDKAYKDARIYYQTKCEKISETCAKIGEIDIDKDKLIPNITILNEMPSYFDSLRKDIAWAIRSLSVEVYNKLSNVDLSSYLNKLALDIKTDSITLQKLREDSDTLSRHMQQKNVSEMTQKKEPTYLGYFVVVILIIIGISIGSGDKSESTYKEPKSTESYSNEESSPSSSPVYKQQVVPSQRDILDMEIEKERTELNEIDSSLAIQKKEIDRLEIKISNLKREIDAGNLQTDIGLSDSEITALNDKIDKYNSLLVTYRTYIDNYNSKVEIFENKRKKLNLKIDQYNNMR